MPPGRRPPSHVHPRYLHMHVVQQDNVVAYPFPGKTALPRLQRLEEFQTRSTATCRAFVCLQVAAGCGFAGWWSDGYLAWSPIRLETALLGLVSKEHSTPRPTRACVPFPSPSLCYATQRAGPGEATNRGGQIRSDLVGSTDCLFASPAQQPMPTCAIYSQAHPGIR